MNISEKSKKIIDSCRFCWMCRHVCPIGNATGQERNTARARALGCSLVVRNAEKIDTVIDNLYECALCGACTNNCMTGWDPKVFVQEVKTDAVLNGVIPEYIKPLIENYMATGNVYGKELCDKIKALLPDGSGDILLVLGQDALYKSAESVANVMKLLTAAKVNVAFDIKSNDTGSAMWFLTGNTAETKAAAANAAEVFNKYETVVVYDPVDLRFIMHDYKEMGIEVKANVVGFNQFILSLIEKGDIIVVNGGREYGLQDNYAYARDLEDSETARKLIALAGVNKEMLLIGKEANMAGSLIMNEYMPDVQKKVAENRWINAANMAVRTVVTENPAEYEMLKQTAPEGYRAISVEEMILENM